MLLSFILRFNKNVTNAWNSLQTSVRLVKIIFEEGNFVWRFWFLSNDLFIFYRERGGGARYAYHDICGKKIMIHVNVSVEDGKKINGWLFNFCFSSHKWFPFKKKNPLKFYARYKMLIQPKEKGSLVILHTFDFLSYLTKL